MDVVDGMAHSVCVISTILDFVCFMYSGVDAIFFHGGRGGEQMSAQKFKQFCNQRSAVDLNYIRKSLGCYVRIMTGNPLRQ